VWIVAGVALVVGLALYVTSPSDWTWWAAIALLIPFTVLVIWRGVEKGVRRRPDGGPPNAGVWGPP
jgi:hypothetical protein